MSQRQWRACFAVVGLVLLVAPWGAVAWSAEGLQPIDVKDLPEAVARAAAKLCPGGEITSAKKEIDTNAAGEVREHDYEMEVTLQGGAVHKIEVDTTPEGKVKLDECNAEGPVAADALPAPVAAALKAACPDGKVTKGERTARLRDDGLETRYEFDLSLPPDKEAEVKLTLAPDGTVKSTSLKAPVAVADVPQALADVLKLLRPGTEVAEAEKQEETRGDKKRIEYEITLKLADGKTIEATVRLGDGDLIRRIEIEE